MARTDRIGTVYLLHFSSPVKHAQHYLGWALDASARVDTHLSGKGNPLVAAALSQGAHVELVREWPGVTRDFERSLKNKKGSAALCPLCLPGYRRKAAERMKRYRDTKRG